MNLDKAYKWLLYLANGICVGSLFDLSRNSLADRTIGELSYPIYITHLFVLGVLAVAGRRVGVQIHGELLLVFVIPVSWLLYRYVDWPVSRWRDRYARAGLAA